MKVGTLLMNTKTGGIGEVIATRVRSSTIFPEFGWEETEYHIYGRRTNKDMWLASNSLESFIRRGVLREWPDELKPKEYIPRYDFQKG
jgi:hypothetical protein